MKSAILSPKECNVIHSLYNINGILGVSVIAGELAHINPIMMEHYSIGAVTFIAVTIIGSMLYVIGKGIYLRFKLKAVKT